MSASRTACEARHAATPAASPARLRPSPPVPGSEPRSTGCSARLGSSFDHVNVPGLAWATTTPRCRVAVLCVVAALLGQAHGTGQGGDLARQRVLDLPQLLVAD